jgi:hypothetical protein
MVQKSSSMFEEAGEFKAEKLVIIFFIVIIESNLLIILNILLFVQTSEEIALYAI